MAADQSNTKLNEIVAGQHKLAGLDNAACVETGNRMSHKFIEMLVKSYREDKVPDQVILDIIMEFDKGVESGAITNKDFLKQFGLINNDNILQ